MKHDLGCNCSSCIAWYAGMSAYTARGRCHCGHPIDDYRLTLKGEVVACPSMKSHA